MEIRPDYYDDFKCIADRCQHNCCIGWEIDIDDDTLQKYKSKTGALGEKLRENISLEPCVHFMLAENERCPFLNQNNLCELILNGGNDMLCQICNDHPRFYNDVDGVTEKGIGICCEAATRIILTKTAPTVLLAQGGEFPQSDFYVSRGEILTVLQDRERPLSARIKEILKYLGVRLLPSEVDWIGVLKNLERLDASWDNYLDEVVFVGDHIPENLEVACEQLIGYFIYRHLSGAIDDLLFCERVQFAILSCYVITTLNKSHTIEEMIEIARMFSCEIEYSDQNVEIILERLNKYNQKQNAGA